MRELLPWLRLLIRRYPLRLLGGMLLILATAVSATGLLATSGWFITATGLAGIAAAAGAVITLDVYVPSGFIRLFALTRVVSRYGERLANHAVVLRLLADLRAWFFARVAPLEPRFLARFRSGDLLNRITADIEALDNLYLRVLGPTVAALLGLTIAAVAGTWYAPGVVWPVVAWMAAAGLLLPALAAARGRRPGVALAEAQARLRTRALDAFAGLAELRIFGRTEATGAGLAEADADYRRWRHRLALAEALGAAAATLTGQLAVVGAVALAVPAFTAGGLSGPGVGLVVLGALGLAELLTPLPGAWFQLGRTRAAIRRLDEVARAPVPREPAEPATPAEHGPLELRGVRFGWSPAAQTVLDGADLHLPAGTSATLEGPSGSGKSSVAALIAGLARPDSGRILLGGLPLAWLRSSDLHARLGVLTQRTELFADTVAGNLRIARPEADEAALWQALTIAALADEVRALPLGVDTWVGEGGVRLSGGQARRLALARVVLYDPAWVVLDEPTAGLDADTAAALAAGLGPWLAGRTALVITHEPERAPAVDARYRLAGGRIEAA
ncbi:MAG: thiol reductant ABC exporter subunit CydC [Pseudomonadota bacterium]